VALVLTLQTPRLELIAASAGVALREAGRLPGWFVCLDVPEPDVWPPPLNDETSQGWFATRIARDGGPPGWWLWYVIRRSDATSLRRLLIGNCGFKGGPDARGSVEIGYSLLPEWQGHGYGTELTDALIEWAFSHDQVARIAAETYPELGASIRVLEKQGFQPTGRGSDRRSVVFELRRTVFECRRGRRAGRE